MGGKNPWDAKRVRLQQMLRDARLAAGLRQSELAALIGSDQSFVSRYERGERRLDLIELGAICQACGIRLAAFVDDFERAPRQGGRR